MKHTKTSIRKEIKFFKAMKEHFLSKEKELSKEELEKQVLNLDRLILERERILGYCKVVI